MNSRKTKFRVGIEQITMGMTVSKSWSEVLDSLIFISLWTSIRLKKL